MSVNFQEIKRRFLEGNVDEKIQIYVNTPDLTNEEYKQLLKLFPLKHLDKLEKALG